MKTGRSINELAAEITRQQQSKKDFLASTALLEMGQDEVLTLDNKMNFKTTEHCHQQIASRLGIPKQYYDKMRKEAPVLLSNNVNHWFKENPEPRMIRTLDGNARAFLSEKYRSLDNYDLLTTSLPIVKDQGCEIVSCEVTDQRMYLKVLFPKVTAEVKKGDIVQAGLVISNSEIGSGSLRVEPLIYRLVCTNGMITNASMRKYHVGRSGAEGNEDTIRELLSDATKEADDKAFWMKVQDVIKGAFRRDIFDGNVDLLRIASERIMTKDPVKVVELVKKEYGFNDTTGSEIMKHLIEGGDISQWGLANAVTATANDAKEYEEATALERAGGKIIELQQRDWSKIAEDKAA